MKEETQSKYLGDILHTSGKIKFTINDRVAKGHGIISEIMSIIEEIPFGHRRVQVGLILRNAKFLNGILFNSECWHGITMADIVRFERLDNILLRGILGAHSKIPVESLHQESGTINIRYTLASRRILYLYDILQRDPKEIVPKYYFAQKVSSIQGDFCKLVESDLKLVGINLTESEISSMTKSTFKKLTKRKCREAAIAYLTKLQKSHSKVEDITYQKHSVQKYLGSPLFNDRTRKLLLALRTKTVRNLNVNFSSRNVRRECQLKCDGISIDSQQHQMECATLLKHVKRRDCIYSDIYSQDIVRQAAVAKYYVELLDARERILDEEDTLSAMDADPLH